MSIVTLLPSDQGRSGCGFSFLQASTSSNGKHFHPFLWHDNYWRPDSLPDQLERDCIAAHGTYTDVIEHHVSKSKDELLQAFELYYKCLSQAGKVVEDNPPQDYADVYQNQVNRCRIECLYNIGILWFLVGLQDHAHYSSGVRSLQEAAGIFNSLLSVTFQAESDQIEVSPDNLRVMAALSMGCAYEILYSFYFKDSFFDVKGNATLAHRASFYYTAVVAIVNNTVAVPDRASLLNLANIKRNFYDGAMLYLMSLEPDTTKGDSRRRRATTSFESALQNVLRMIPGDRPNVEVEIQFFVDRCTNYRRLLRRNQIPEATFVAVPKRPAAVSEQQYPRNLTSTLPDWFQSLLELATDKVGAEAPHAAPSTQPEELEPITVNTFVENIDLRGKPDPVTSETTSARYHLVRAMVQLQGQQEEPKPLSQAAVVFVVDFNHPNEKQRNTFRDLIGLCLRAGRLTSEDRIGLVVFDSDGLARVELDDANPENIEKLANQANRQNGRGKFAGSKGTNLCSGVSAAVTALYQEDSDVVREVIVVSDGWDASAHSDIAAWAQFIASDSEKLQQYNIPVHCFAMSAAADHQMLSAMAKLTEGSYTTVRDAESEEAVSSLRRFLVTCTTDLKGRLTGAATVSVNCAKGILIAGLARKEEATIDYSTLRTCPSSAEVTFPPLAAGNTSHAMVTFAVPLDISRQDIPVLGEVTVSFAKTSALGGGRVNVSKVLVNESWNRLVDPEIHHWLAQLVVDHRKGTVSLISPGEKHFYAKGGEMVCTRDSVKTQGAASSVTLTSVEGIRVELDKDTDCTFNVVERGGIQMTLQEGSANIITTRDSSVRCNIDKYHIEVKPETAIRLSLADGVFRACCMLGQALISTDGNAKIVKLDSPKQTSARSPQPPVQPWAVTEDVFQDWISMGNTTTKRLMDSIAIQTQVCRLHVSAIIRRVSRYLMRALRLGTLKQSKALVRCRIFFTNHLLTNAKLFILNNIAYATSNTLLDAVRHELEVIIAIASPSHRYSLILDEMVKCNDIVSALCTERCRGLCTLYELPSFKIQIQALMNERERLLLLAELARQEEARQALDQEARRRRELAAELFQRWDFDGTNAIGSHEIQTVLYAVGNSVEKVDILINRWSSFANAVGRDKCYTAEQFVAIILFTAEPFEAFEYNTVMEAVEVVVDKTAKLIDESRLTRATYCIFTLLDEEKLGVIRWNSLVKALHQCFGDNVATFRRIEKLTVKAIETVQELQCQALVEGADVTVENIEHIPITAYVFIRSMLAFMNIEDAMEATIHQQLRILFRHLKQVIKYPENIQYVMLRERKLKEKKHLEEWDMRHVFNGITRRELSKVTDEHWAPPRYIQDISHPFTLLLGLSKARANLDHRHFGAEEDHWSHVKTLLRRDSAGFFKFLQNFPILSISHKQAQRVSKTLEAPELDASNLLKVSPVLTALVNWLRITLRIAFLEHDFEVPVPVEEAVVSRAIAEHNDMKQLMSVPPLPALVAPVSTINVQSMGHKFSHFFNKVYDPAPKVGYGEVTRFPVAQTQNAQSLLAHRSRKGTESSTKSSGGASPSMQPSRPSTAGTNSKRNFQFRGARPTSASSRRSVGTPF